MTMTPLNFGIPPLAVGSIYTGSGTGTPTELPIGANGYILKSNGTNPLWSVFSASDITTGTLNDARLSSNVSFLNVSNTFTASQTIDLGTGALPTSVNAASQMLRFVQVDGIQPTGLEANTWSGAVAGGGMALYGVAAGGTRSTPAATIDNTNFFGMGAFGYDGSVYTSQMALVRIMADGTWSGSNRGTKFQIAITDNGSLSRYDLAIFQRGALGLKVAPTAGNGLLQFASGTTKANGIAFGTDTFIYRSGGNAIKTDGTLLAVGNLQTSGDVQVQRSGSVDAQNLIQVSGLGSCQFGMNNSGATNAAGASQGAIYLGSNGAFELQMTTTGAKRLRIGAGGELHFGGGTPIAKQTAAAAATDAATTQTLANSLRTILINLGLAQ